MDETLTDEAARQLIRAYFERRLAAAELTPRQEAVMRMLAKGDDNEAIAYELGLSVNTVKNHMSALLTQLGAETRTHAVMIVLGLAEPNPRQPRS